MQASACRSRRSATPSFPHYYRRHEAGETEEQFSARMANALDALIQAEGPDTIAAFFAEPVMGAGGAIVPPAGYFDKIQAVLSKYDILFVADEVICGFARTGEMWGSQTYGINPDMITSAKALSAAMQPISAVLINERIHAAMLAQSDQFGNFAHGYTYAGHPVAAAVALEVQKIYDEIDIVARAKRLGPVMQSALGRLIAHPLVGDVCGIGLILGMELMRDGEKRIPFDPALAVGQRVDATVKAPRADPTRGGRPPGVCPAAGDRGGRDRGDRRTARAHAGRRGARVAPGRRVVGIVERREAATASDRGGATGARSLDRAILIFTMSNSPNAPPAPAVACEIVATVVDRALRSFLRRPDLLASSGPRLRLFAPVRERSAERRWRGCEPHRWCPMTRGTVTLARRHRAPVT